jgi:hypothetical protein
VAQNSGDLPGFTLGGGPLVLAMLGFEGVSKSGNATRDQVAEVRPKPISVTTEGKELVVRLPLSKPVTSKSGKTRIVAGTMGALPTPVVIRGAHVILNASAYINPGQPKWKQAAQVSLARFAGRLK